MVRAADLRLPRLVLPVNPLNSDMTYIPANSVIDTQGLSMPTGLVVSPVGISGSTAYGYRVSAVDDESESIACPTASTMTGNAVLSESNYNLISWTAVAGATSYKVYGRTGGSGQLLATVEVPEVSYQDTGS